MTRTTSLYAALVALVLAASASSAQDTQNGPPVLPAAAPDVEGPPLAQDVGMSVRAPEQVLLGQWFELVLAGPLSTDAELGFSLRPPDLMAKRSVTKATITGVELRLPLVAVRAGTLTLDGLMIEDGETLLGVAPIQIEVLTELPPEATARVAAPLAALSLPLPAVPVWPVLAALLLGLALIGMWVVRAGRELPVVVYTEPPDQRAMRALEHLRLGLPNTSEQVAVFILALSDVLRDYIERRFLVHAPARTTEEFLIEALREPELAQHKPSLERFLTLCDLVKYARFRPAPSEAVTLLDTACAFVEQTR
ncbi:MAG: hypothetical protein DRQ55_08070 [Planctomycetota bacterium]|nr:MAG: hypothetical protein DRQ55_08070 [Planctomycetota bacterium]